MFKKSMTLLGVTALCASLLIGCGQSGEKKDVHGEGNLSGTVKIDGSSTVYPISQAVGEEFMAANPGVKVTVSESGTGGGFEKWALGETDINNASRPIKDEEKEAAEKNGIEALEVLIGYDGVSVVVNKENDFVDELTFEELKKIWEPNSKVKTWKDVSPEWPNEPIKLYGPGTASGTFDYFTEEIVGEEGKSRTDYTASEDDNTLVQGIAGDKYALGYFGYSYYAENTDKIKVVKLKKDQEAVEPNEDTINDGSYPLSREIYLYVSNKALERPEVKAFIKFYLTEGRKLVAETGYVPLSDSQYEEELKSIESN